MMHPSIFEKQGVDPEKVSQGSPLLFHFSLKLGFFKKDPMLALFHIELFLFGDFSLFSKNELV